MNFIVRYLRYHQRENKSIVSKSIGVKANGLDGLFLRDPQNNSFHFTPFFSLVYVAYYTPVCCV